MATFGHLATGAALSRLVRVLDRRGVTWQDAAVITAAAEVPDVDFALPVQHRGMTHSVAFAAAIGIGVAAAYSRLGLRRALAMGTVAAIATSSHALLDIATAEAGAEAAWPATERKMSLPIAPLPAMPIGRQILTRAGLLQAVGELAWAAPLAVVGLWPWVMRLREERS